MEIGATNLTYTLLVVGVVLLMLALIFFFAWRLPEQLESISGKHAKKEIEKLREQNKAGESNFNAGAIPATQGLTNTGPLSLDLQPLSSASHSAFGVRAEAAASSAVEVVDVEGGEEDEEEGTQLFGGSPFFAQTAGPVWVAPVGLVKEVEDVMAAAVQRIESLAPEDELEDAEDATGMLDEAGWGNPMTEWGYAPSGQVEESVEAIAAPVEVSEERTDIQISELPVVGLNLPVAPSHMLETPAEPLGVPAVTPLTAVDEGENESATSLLDEDEAPTGVFEPQGLSRIEKVMLEVRNARPVYLEETGGTSDGGAHFTNVFGEPGDVLEDVTLLQEESSI